MGSNHCNVTPPLAQLSLCYHCSVLVVVAVVCACLFCVCTCVTTYSADQKECVLLLSIKF